MLILFIAFVLVVTLFVAIAVRALIAESFSDPDWMGAVNWEEPNKRDVLEMENTEFTLGHNIKHHSEEFL